MDILEYLASCLEEAALQASDGSRPFTGNEATAIAESLLADEKLTFRKRAWGIMSIDGQVYLHKAVQQAAAAAGRTLSLDDVKGITGFLLWYGENLGIIYVP
jgi:hypothetical protein